MKVIRKVRDVELNEGNLASNGLYNLSTKNEVSFWFDSDTKDRLMKLGDANFWHQAKDIIKESNID